MFFFSPFFFPLLIHIVYIQILETYVEEYTYKH